MQLPLGESQAVIAQKNPHSEQTLSKELESIEVDQAVFDEERQRLLGQAHPLMKELETASAQQAQLMRPELERLYYQLMAIDTAQALSQARLAEVSFTAPSWKDPLTHLHFVAAWNRMTRYNQQRREAVIVFRALRNWLGLDESRLDARSPR
jgi:hypothetical protein